MGLETRAAKHGHFLNATVLKNHSPEANNDRHASATLPSRSETGCFDELQTALPIEESPR